MTRHAKLGLLALTLGLLCGCATKFNRQNFEMIHPNVDRRADVRAILGEPTADFQDQWLYDDVDRHITAVIYFDDDGTVAAKEWMDTTAGTWEGRNPSTDPPPEGEVRHRSDTTREYDD